MKYISQPNVSLLHCQSRQGPRVTWGWKHGYLRRGAGRPSKRPSLSPLAAGPLLQ